MYKRASQNLQKAAVKTHREDAAKTARKHKAAAEQANIEKAAKKLAIALNAQQNNRTEAMMAAYQDKKARTRAR